MTKGTYLGEFEQIVLLAIAQLEDAGYGVSILAEIERRTGRRPSIGAVYTTLARLEGKDYVHSWLGSVSEERGGRAKRFFALRPAGIRALEVTRRALEGMWRGLEWSSRPGKI